MFPPANMKALDEKKELPNFSVHDYVATHLQQVFLPWPLSSLHLLPDWMILSGLIIIGLILIKIFMDPCIAICHLLRDNSLTITEKISTAVIPATSIARKNRNQMMTEGEGRYPMKRTNRSLEERIYEIEKRLNNFQAMVMRDKAKEEGKPRY